MIPRIRVQTWNMHQKLLALPRLQKRIVLVLFDLCLLGSVALGIVWLRRLSFDDTNSNTFILVLLAPVITVAIFAWLGLYRLVTRYIGHRGNTRIASSVTLAALVWALLVFMTGQQGVPRSAIFLYAVAGTVGVVASRHFAAWLLKSGGMALPPLRDEVQAKNVLIYGAGLAGVRLLEAIRGVADRVPIGFIDTEPSLWGQYVGGLKVYKPEKITALIERRDVQEVLLALPQSERQQRRRILDELKGAVFPPLFTDKFYRFEELFCFGEVGAFG